MSKVVQRVLVVDDEEDLRLLLQELLREEGYQVDVAKDGEEAVEKLSSLAMDLVVLDMMMPKIDGWGVLNWLKAKENAPRVIAVTGGTFDRYRPHPEGVVATLSKPFLFSDLMGIVASIEAGKA
jgi:CheY-like chemotaxis protein